MGCSHNKVLHLSVGVFYVFLNIEIHTFWNTDDKYKYTKSNWWDWSNVSTLSSNTLSPLLLCSDNQQHIISIASIIHTQNYFQLTHTQIYKTLIYTNIQLTNTQIIVVFCTIPTQNHYQCTKKFNRRDWWNLWWVRLFPNWVAEILMLIIIMIWPHYK